MATLLTLYILGGLLLIALSIPMIQRKVKPNSWYGFRTSRTLADPELWYDVNAYSGKRLLVAGIFILVTSLLFYLIPGLSVDAYALLCLAATTLALGAAVVQSLVYLNNKP